MESVRHQNPQTALTSLEAAAASARGGFGCIFSSSDEYEMALITARRAEGHYGRPRSRLPVLMFIACALLVAGIVLVLS